MFMLRIVCVVCLLKNIKILVSTFKSNADSVGEFIVPILSGSELYDDTFRPMLKDNTGDNISDKNESYCELTAQYWAWKNLDCDFYGLMHHRRYFDFNPKNIYSSDSRKLPKSYRIFDTPDEKTLEIICADYNTISELTNKYRIIAPVRENIFESVKKHYDKSDGTDFDDLALVCEIIKKKYPKYLSSALQYLDGHIAYFCNMFIMDKELFFDYSEWLFDILEEFEKQKPPELKKSRECGKIGERLFGIYMTYIINNTDIKWAELPRAHFCGLGGATKNPSFDRNLYRLCPPGSRRRSILRKLKQNKKRG